MVGLTVGGVTIPIATQGNKTDRFDGADRSPMFDNSYRVSVAGGSRRDFHFSTPPVARALGDSYLATLGNPAAQICSGDIIAIPTMCCAEVTNWTPVMIQGGHYIVIDFVLHEIQSAKTLLKYSPGDTISGEAFSRSTVADYNNINGSLIQAAINAKRDSHYPTIGGTRSTRLEGSATNPLLWASDLSNAAWVKTTATITTGISDPTGGTGACTIAATAGNGNALQHIADASSLSRTTSWWIKRRTGTGAVQILGADGIAWNTVAVTAGWVRFPVTTAASVARWAGIRLATSGDAVDVFIAQIDDLATLTSEIPTTTVAVTRAIDSYSLPLTTSPQEMTAYAKFVESGTVLGGSVLFQVSDAPGNVPIFRGLASAGTYEAQHITAVSSVTSQLGVAPAIGDTVEIVARLFGDGSVDITQSINGGAPVAAAQTVALAMATAWSGQLLWLNSAGTAGGYGFIALQSFKIVAGARSLAEMRAL